MNQTFRDYLRFMLDNWKTSSLGMITASGYLLWLLGRIDTQAFVSLLAFMAAAGLFSMRDPK
jgi:hypothetical protein